MRVYFFNWPSPVGGADTKFGHLLGLLGAHYEITVVPNDRRQMEQEEWAAWVADCGCRACLLEDLPDRLEGWAVSLCNQQFFRSGALFEARRRGLGIAWSSEMMWHFSGECAAVAMGLVDTVLYVSPVQRRRLEPGYRHALGWRGTDLHRLDDPEAEHGWILTRNGRPPVRWVTVGNFIDPSAFPFRQRGHWRAEGRPFTVGRLSRPDPDKFPDIFPMTYESLGLRAPVRFRVMGWSEDLARRWSGHHFDDRWDLVPTAAVPAARFLDSLDLLVYDTSHRFCESWGRAVVEAMLTGAVPLVPADPRHHLPRLVPDGVAGFHCADQDDFARHAIRLQSDPQELATISAQARRWAEETLCRPDRHRTLWDQVFAAPPVPPAGVFARGAGPHPA